MLWIGTSGFQYPEWKGTFYPEKMATAKMLAYYAERFNTTEINYTFYRMPSFKTLEGWAAQTPAHFKFTLKASKRITHLARLQNCEQLAADFCEIAGNLGSKLGMLLFQLPPNMKKDVAVLDKFLAALPPGANAAFEFRHASWHDGEVFDCLRKHRQTLCIADSEKMSTPLEITSDHAYFRLRDEGYGPDDIARWAKTVANVQAQCREVYVYFKHEEKGLGPEFAKQLEKLLAAPAQQSSSETAG